MSTVEELRRLTQLRAKGALSEADFDKARAALLEDVQDAEVTSALPIPEGQSPSGPKEPPQPNLLGFSLGGTTVLAAGSWLLGASPVVAGTIGVVALAGITWMLFKSLDAQE